MTLNILPELIVTVGDKFKLRDTIWSPAEDKPDPIVLDEEVT